MKIKLQKILPVVCLGSLLLSSCTGLLPATDTSPLPTLPAALTDAGAVGEAQAVATAFLTAWQKQDFAGMYAGLSQLTRDALTAEEFEARYADVHAKMNLGSLDYEILGALLDGSAAQVSYRVTYHTRILGDLHSQMVMPLVRENGQWRIRWDDGLIHEWLRGGNMLRLTVESPSRGTIYDRYGRGLASFTDSVSLGVVPDRIDPLKEEAMLAELAILLDKTPEQLKAMYSEVDPSWYVPLADLSAAEIQDKLAVLRGFEPGLELRTFRARYYDEGGAAPHVVGYIQPIPEERAAEYEALGYLADEKVGAAGLELWGEPYLRGQPKAALYVVSPQGEIVTRLADVPAKPAENIYSTIDKDLQVKIQQSMQGLRGAVVAIELDTGKVLAMVSSPSFDANIFEPTTHSETTLAEVYTDPTTPMLNRATQGVYPLGSVFKTITMAAALESGRYTPTSEYVCGHVYNELDVPFYDWTYQHGVAASGLLTLQGALIRSCNPWFWHVGLDLYNLPEHQLDVVKMAEAFGLGQVTGIEQVAEVPGSVPRATTPYEAIGLAIGQDQLQVTPLQVANFIAAIANGGTLYRPQLVDKVVTLDGQAVFTAQPEERGRLPVSQENLQAIQEAMYGVVNSTQPMGTAYFILANLPFPVAGKTGTAQTATDPHAWFGGYTQADREDKPDIAVVVILENAGEGSVMAAPLFRRVVQLYFSDNTDPGPLLPWETTIYGGSAPAATETPEGTPTP